MFISSNTPHSALKKDPSSSVADRPAPKHVHFACTTEQERPVQGAAVNALKMAKTNALSEQIAKTQRTQYEQELRNPLIFILAALITAIASGIILFSSRS